MQLSAYEKDDITRNDKGRDVSSFLIHNSLFRNERTRETRSLDFARDDNMGDLVFHV